MKRDGYERSWVRYECIRTSLMQGDFALGLRRRSDEVVRYGTFATGARKLAPEVVAHVPVARPSQDEMGG